jgi:hypothetical protein
LIEPAMAKPFLQLAALGVASLVIWKIASLVLLPFLMFAFKIALVVGLVVLAIWYFKKHDKPKDDATAG